MTALFAITFPFFALVLAGYLAARWRWLPLEAVPGLNAFVLFFALPAMLFRLGSRLPVSQTLSPAVLGVYLLCALVVVGFTIAMTLTRRLGLKNAAFGALVATFPNSGFMGVPLITSLLGTQAAGPVMATIVADMVVTSSLCIALAQTQAERDTEPGAQGHASTRELTHIDSSPELHSQATRPPSLIGRMLRSSQAALTNPLPWAIALGAVASVTELRLPAPVDRLIALLADAASPVALFTIGAVLWRARVASDVGHRAEHGRAQLKAVLHAAPVALIKLFLHPLLVALIGLSARQLGAPLSSLELLALVLVAALPSASNVSLLSERYRADTGRVARIIMISTVLAFLSFTALVALLGVKPR